ncbi:MAG: T9SS type A sorting domain-containing protein [Melioribacter sp.]|nr:T9SS type A sorting domain-containing protein [Melioribacter sp.]
MFYVNVNGSRFFSSPHTVEANAIGRAFASWQNVEPATISFVYGGFDNATNANDNKSVLYWNNDINVSAYVIASLTTYGNNYTGVLTNVDIWFNDRYYEWTDGTLVFDSKIMDIQSIATHEIGHFLGLNESDPCMDNAPTMMTAPLWEAYFKSEAESPNLGIRNLAQGDMDGLNYLYGTTLRVPQIFTTIEQAISFAQSGQTILVNNGNYSISNNLTISSGVVLQVNPGVTFNFAIGASLIVNGTLNAVGNSTNRITFTRSGTTGNWGSIIFSGSGASGSTLNYVDMQYGTNIQATNTSNITVQNSTFTNNSSAITFTGSTGTVSNCYISSNSNAGIIVQNGSTVTCNYNTIKTSVTGLAYLAGSYGNIGQNDIAYNSNSGISVGSSCSPLFKNVPNAYSRNNRITNNGRGINITSTNSLPVMYNAINCSGQNTIYDNSPYDIYNGCSYTLDAIGVYWKNGNPSYSLTYGSIYKTPFLSSDPWAGIPLPKQNASSFQSNDPLLVGSQLRGEWKYKEAKDFYISYLEKNPDDQRAYVELYSCYTNETASEITKFFEKAAKKDKEQDLLLGYIYLKQGKIKPAKNINDAILSSNKNNKLSSLASLNNFYISLYYENDEATATAILDRLKREKNETNEYEISFAEYALKTFVPVEFKVREIQPKELVEQTTPPIPEKLLLYDNYPNPFNPSTTIRYQIPQYGHISLKVYDMLGREVAQLVNEVKRAGEYTVSFDGSKLSSGVYIYKLVGNNVNISKKMILMK